MNSKFQLSIGVAVLCLPWLRYAQPNLPRPIRVPLVFPIVYLLATVFVTVVPMYASPEETGYGCLMILTSVPVYIIFIAWRSKPKWFQKSMGNYIFFIVNYPISDSFLLVYLCFYDFCFYLYLKQKQQQITFLLGGLTRTLQKVMMVVRPKASVTKVFILFYDFCFVLCSTIRHTVILITID